jgi:hypothetical protein
MQPSQDFENVYEKYSPVLYNIALRISSSQTDAECLLIKTFKEINHQKLFLQNENSMCLSFIKLLLRIAKSHSNCNIYKCELFTKDLFFGNSINKQIS